jgi:hypothetical protein
VSSIIRISTRTKTSKIFGVCIGYEGTRLSAELVIVF